MRRMCILIGKGGFRVEYRIIMKGRVSVLIAAIAMIILSSFARSEGKVESNSNR